MNGKIHVIMVVALPGARHVRRPADPHVRRPADGTPKLARVSFAP
jgi:hypothetical protein